MPERATWASKAGFVLASAGAAVGLGAIWKFPWLAGSNGGAVFVIPYVILSLTLGFVFLTAEITLGYMGRGSIVTTMRKLGGSKWVPAGYLGVVTGLLVLSFYSVIGGWTIAYLVDAILGRGLVTSQAELGARFGALSGDPLLAVGYQALFLTLTAGVVALKVSKGIERLSRILKSCAQIVGLTTAASILGALMVMPAVFAFHLDPAAGPGLTFVTMPVIFAQLPFGGLFAVAFFACLTFAALTSSVSMLELDTAFLVDEFHVSRTTGAIISTLVIMVIGFFCALSFGPLADTKFLGKNVFDWCDFLTSNISLPIGGLIVALLAGLVVWPKFREALSVPPAPSDQWFRIFRLLLVVACPILVVIVLVTGLL